MYELAMEPGDIAKECVKVASIGFFRLLFIMLITAWMTVQRVYTDDWEKSPSTYVTLICFWLSLVSLCFVSDDPED